MKQCFPNPPYHLFPAIVENWQSCKHQFGKSFYIYSILFVYDLESDTEMMVMMNTVVQMVNIASHTSLPDKKLAFE